MSKKIFRIIRNKYFIVSVLALVWLVFFDGHNILTQFSRKKEIKELEEKKSFYEDEISVDKEILEKIQNDTNFMEKYGREKYLMKKENEDVFLIIREEKEDN